MFWKTLILIIFFLLQTNIVFGYQIKKILSLPVEVVDITWNVDQSKMWICTWKGLSDLYGGQIWKSLDYGVTWAIVYDTLEDINYSIGGTSYTYEHGRVEGFLTLEYAGVDSGNDVLLMGNYYNDTPHRSHILRSIDDGTTWTPVTHSGTVDVPEICSLGGGKVWACETADAECVACSGGGGGDKSGTIFYSADYGENWVEYSEYTDTSRGPAMLYFSYDGDNVLLRAGKARVYGNQARIFKSTNDGVNWQIEIDPDPEDRVPADSDDYTGYQLDDTTLIGQMAYCGDGVVLATGTNYSNDKIIWKSINAGTSWSKTILATAAAGGEYNIVGIGYMGSGMVYVGAKDQIFKSVNKGSGWQAYDGLPQDETAWQMKYSTKVQKLFICGESGLYTLTPNAIEITGGVTFNGINF